MTHGVLLSICIPAYNQPDSLCEVLDSIVVDFEDPKIRDRVEIIIHDDASPSGSLASVISPYQKKYENIHFTRHKENIGFDRNLLGVVDEALGKFCWLMSDNDALVEGALQKVISLLDKYPDVGYAYVQARGYDGELKNELGGDLKSMEIVRVRLQRSLFKLMICLDFCPRRSCEKSCGMPWKRKNMLVIIGCTFQLFLSFYQERISFMSALHS